MKGMTVCLQVVHTVKFQVADLLHFPIIQFRACEIDETGHHSVNIDFWLCACETSCIIGFDGIFISLCPKPWDLAISSFSG